MKKTLITLILGILLIASVSAWTSDRFIEDTSKTLERESLVVDRSLATNYGTYQVIEHKWWDILKIWTEEIKKEITLIDNTATCFTNCEATKEITLMKDGSLIDDIKFYNIDKDMAEEDIRWWRIEIWDNPLEATEEYVENVCSGGYEDDEGYIDEVCIPVVKTRNYYYKLVDDYQYVCKDSGKVDEKNGTAIQECSNVLVGEKEQKYSGWVNYNLGDKLPAGTYEVRLTGNKRYNRQIDWVITTSGRTLDRWAIWGETDMTEGLVAQYRANTQDFSVSNQFNVTDFTGINNGTLSGRTFNDGTVSGGVTIEDGAITCDGVDGYVRVNQTLKDYSSKTINFWYKTNFSSNDYSRIISDEVSNNIGNLWISIRNGTNSIIISSYDTEIKSNTHTGLTDNTWYMISIRMTNNYYLVTSINNQDGKAITLNNALNGSSFLDFGKQAYSTANYSKGSYDDVIIFNRYLTDTEITTLYNQGRGKYSSVTNGLVFQASGRDFAGTEATPTTIYDTNHLGDGKVNQSLSFDGVDGRVNLGNPSNLNFNSTQPFAISLWIKPSSVTGGQHLFAKDGVGVSGSYEVYLFNQNIVFRQNNSLITTSGNEANIGDWINIVVLNNRSATSNSQIYVNGVLKTTGTIANVDLGTGLNAFIGGRNGGTGWFNGSIDEVRIYNRSLTADEIAYLYNSGMGREDSSNAWIELNSPADGSTQYTNLVTHNATAYVTSGAYLVNVSLWNNKGGWSLKETRDISSVRGNITTEEEIPSLTLPYTDSQTPEYATRINVTEDLTLVNVTRYHGVTATRCLLQNDSRTQLASGIFVGENCELNYDLEVGVIYRVVIGSAGASYTRKYLDGSPGFPFTSTNGLVNYISGTDSSHDPQTSAWMNLGNLTVSSNQTVSEREQTFTQTYDAGETILWNMQFCDTDGDCGFATANKTFTIDSTPPTIALNYPTSLIDYGKLNGTLQLNLTATDTNLDSVWYDYNGTNITIAGATSGIENVSDITLSTKKNITIYANDTAGNLNTTIFSWDYRVFENSRSHNTTSYETSYETYSINVTSNSSLTAVKLLFNETEISLTESSSGFWTYSRDLPNTTIGNNSIYFNFTYAGSQISSDTSYQNVSSIDFNICSTTPFLNISFKDENSLEFINASIPTSEFIYYLGTGTQNKTLTYSNTTDNFNYGFCFTPIDRSIKVLPTVQYRQVSDYPQRIWEPTLKTYTNSTTNQVLYLLNTNDGIFVTYQVLTSAEVPIEGVEVTITRIVSGETIQVGSGLTDSAGTVTFWLNPDFQHIALFSKDGYEDYTFTHFPTQNAYTIKLGGDVTIDVGCSDGISQSIKPSSDFLNRYEVYNFNYSISSSYWNLTEFKFTLLGDSVNLGSNVSTSSSGGIISVNNINVSNYTTITMNYYFDNGDTDCGQISGKRVWITQSIEGREFSIWQVAQDFTLYTGTGLFGLDNFGKTLISFLVIIILVGGLSRRYGIASEGAIMGILFGVVFLLDFGLNMIPQINIGDGTIVSIKHFFTYITFLMLFVSVIRTESGR